MLRTNPLSTDRHMAMLRPPPYHPELQPIEKCWGVMKQSMAQPGDFPLTGLRQPLETAWTKVTSDTLKGIMKKVAHWEDYHCEQESLLDAVDDEDGRITCPEEDSIGVYTLWKGERRNDLLIHFGFIRRFESGKLF